MTEPEVPESLRSLRVALVHDYLNQEGGAEKVVAVFARMFPAAPLYTSVYDSDAMPAFWRTRNVRTSFLQRISPSVRLAKPLLPLYPVAFEQFDLSKYDLVLSSTTAFAKGIITHPPTCHVCYCNNPARFLWTYQEYVRYERLPPGARPVLPFIASRLRVWDFAAAQRVDYFIAGSHNAASRIRKYYRRDSDVVQSPVDASSFHASNAVGEHYLVVARLQPYKRIDLAVEACTRLRLPLRVIGDGPDRARLQQLAGPTVQFLGRVEDARVRTELAECRALIWPGEEDFGLAPLEAQASGRPVIAYRAGGALETVKEGETGVFFSDPTPESLCLALERFQDTFDPVVLRAHAMRFDVTAFKRRIYEVLARRYEEYRRSLWSPDE